MVYEVEIAEARLTDLTDHDTVVEIVAGFRGVLAGELEQANGTDAAWYWVESLRRMIAGIDSGRVGVGTLKVVTRRSGELFTEYLQERGYDGLIAAEGG